MNNRLVFIIRTFVGVVLFLLVFLTLVQHIRNLRLNKIAQELKEQVRVIKKENHELTLKRESYYQLANLEEIAKERLDMGYPSKISYIEVEE